jgi:transposase-like protein
MTDMRCKYCQSENTIKFGIQCGNQMYWCKDCKRKFKNDNSLYNGKVPANDVSTALLAYYTGSSINDIRSQILQAKGYKPAQSTVYQWIDKFTDKAVKYYGQFQPKVGNIWIADETVIHLDNSVDIWVWDIIDQDTKFLLASKISYRRTLEDAKTLFKLAYKIAGKKPDTVLTDGLNLYPQAVSSVFGDNVHTRTSPFVKKDEGTSSRGIERWHETLKERIKVIYGLRNIDSALEFLDGFIAYYNFIRPHKGLNDKPPAEVAGIQYDVKSWADVTHLGETKKMECKPEYNLSPELLSARLQMTGTPYKTGGGKYGSHKGVNKSAILAEKKRQLKDKLRNRRRALEAKRKFEKEAENIAMASIMSARKPRKKKAE